MKQILIVLALTLGMAVSTAVNAKSMRAMQSPVTGVVTDVEGHAVAYATVVAMLGDRQAAGATTDEDGTFSLVLADGEYSVSVEFLGYKPVVREISVHGTTDLGTVVLEQESIKIEGVEVTAQVIRREADRFVVDVANMPAAIGKDGVDLLQSSPGVFINDDKISINGQSGSKVYVNEREVKYTGDRLLNYLRGLKSEDIQKIEVVPVSGADYDADSSGGIIKITLKQKRDDGFMGSASFRTSLNDLQQNYTPSVSLDYRNGKWTLSGSGYYAHNVNNFISEEKTVYGQSDNVIESRSEMPGHMNWYNGKIGAIYEVDDRHSLGAEVEYGGYSDGNVNDTWSRFTGAVPPVVDESRGLYENNGSHGTVTGRFNYIGKLDTLGSMVKILADYTHDYSSTGNDYSTHKSTLVDGELFGRDSLYRDRSGTNYDIATVSISYDKVFSPKFTLKTGGKYTCNIMESFADYDYEDNATGQWMTRPTYNYDVDYTENIAAAYVIGTAKLGRWGITAGLRGEYTNTSGRGNVARQNYFSLFPNANVSFGLTKDHSYMLIGQYSRTIHRPNFWSLNPARMQVSEYTYTVGNPDLTPGFTNSLSLSLVMKYKYTVTFMTNISSDDINQVISVDPDDPNVNYLRTENLDRVENYGVAVNLPFQFTKWWSANVNGFGGYLGTRIRKGGEQEFHPMANWNVSMTFTLPAQFYLNLEYFGMTSIYMANIMINNSNNVSFSVKKRLFKDKLALSAGVRNIIPQRQRITYSDASFVRTLNLKQGWNRPAFNFSVSYNFNTGKKFSKRVIESDADSSRLSK